MTTQNQTSATPIQLFETLQIHVEHQQPGAAKRTIALIRDHGGTIQPDAEKADYILIGKHHSNQRRFNTPTHDRGPGNLWEEWTTKEFICRFGQIVDQYGREVEKARKRLLAKDWKRDGCWLRESILSTVTSPSRSQQRGSDGSRRKSGSSISASLTRSTATASTQYLSSSKDFVSPTRSPATLPTSHPVFEVSTKPKGVTSTYALSEQSPGRSLSIRGARSVALSSEPQDNGTPAVEPRQREGPDTVNGSQLMLYDGEPMVDINKPMIETGEHRRKIRKVDARAVVSPQDRPLRHSNDTSHLHPGSRTSRGSAALEDEIKGVSPVQSMGTTSILPSVKRIADQPPSTLTPIFSHFGIRSSFHVLCEGFMKQKMDLLIVTIGGGELASLDQAAFLVMDHPPGRYTPTTHALRQAYKETLGRDSRMAVSFQWVDRCTGCGTMVDPREYQITFDPETPVDGDELKESNAANSSEMISVDDSDLSDEDNVNRPVRSVAEPGLLMVSADEIDVGEEDDQHQHADNDYADEPDLSSDDDDRSDKGENETDTQDDDGDFVNNKKSSSAKGKRSRPWYALKPIYQNAPTPDPRPKSQSKSTSSKRIVPKHKRQRFEVEEQDTKQYAFLTRKFREWQAREDCSGGAMNFCRVSDREYPEFRISFETIYRKYRLQYAEAFPSLPYVPKR